MTFFCNVCIGNFQFYGCFKPEKSLVNPDIIRVSYFMSIIHTQGVFASNFPISIQTQTQGHHRCQKMLKNHVPVSDFATMLLNLKKKIKNLIFFSCKKCNSKLKKHFSGYFSSILDICIMEYVFLT